MNRKPKLTQVPVPEGTAPRNTPDQLEQIRQWVESAMGGFTEEELSAAFDLVKNAENWKYPVDAIVDGVGGPENEARRCIDTAITFYAGCVAEWIPLGEGKYHVVAAGYYNSVGS